MGGSAALAAARRRGGHWLAVLVVAAAILVASVVPLPASTPPTGLVGSLRPDLWLHAVGYGVLAAVLVRAIAADGRVATVATVAVIAVVAATGYGLAMELLQVPLPTRSFEVADLLADGVGGAVGVGAWWWARLRDDRRPGGTL